MAPDSIPIAIAVIIIINIRIAIVILIEAEVAVWWQLDHEERLGHHLELSEGRHRNSELPVGAEALIECEVRGFAVEPRAT